MSVCLHKSCLKKPTNISSSQLECWSCGDGVWNLTPPFYLLLKQGFLVFPSIAHTELTLHYALHLNGNCCLQLFEKFYRILWFCLINTQWGGRFNAEAQWRRDWERERELLLVYSIDDIDVVYDYKGFLFLNVYVHTFLHTYAQQSKHSNRPPLRKEKAIL